MGIFAILMPSRDFHSHENLVRMNLFHGTLFRARIDANSIAGLQHFRYPLSYKDSILRRVVAAQGDFLLLFAVQRRHEVELLQMTKAPLMPHWGVANDDATIPGSMKLAGLILLTAYEDAA
jgi:hypothetical protein